LNFRSKLAAAGVTIGLATGSVFGSAPAAAPAQAATTKCGAECVALYNLVYGKSDVLGVVGASGTSAHTGQAVDLQAASNSNQAEDWALNN
jgi:hypothetical protein